MREYVLDMVQLMVLVKQIREAFPTVSGVAQSLHNQYVT